MSISGSSDSTSVTGYGKSDSEKVARATIGTAVNIKGEISGQEDILIEGSVEGLISLKQNAVTVAKSGKVTANVHGLVIIVEGEVTGDLFGTERVIVQESGRVCGNITSPKVAIKEGARVRGSLNTDVDHVDNVPEHSTNFEFSKLGSKTSDAAILPKQNGHGRSSTVIVER